MRSSLSTGLDTAKGLSIAWNVPLVAVNHMQAHALTPRLTAALSASQPFHRKTAPAFPFLSLLVSGGHTLLVRSTTVTNHSILASTLDMAIGDALDKIARSVLPPGMIESSSEVMYGRLLETFVFPKGPQDHHYAAPARRAEELERRFSRWGWGLAVPLAESKSMEFSFSGLESRCRTLVETKGASIGEEERRDLGREAMRLAFEHLASRVVMALQQPNFRRGQSLRDIDTLVVSGGVASNAFLKTV